jgi:galactokinase
MLTPGLENMSSEIESFIGSLSPLGFFEKGTDIFVSRAPGRLDVMGGIADYSGSLMLEMPIREATKVAVQKTENRTIEIISENDGDALRFEMPLDDFYENGEPVIYRTARNYFQQNLENHWSAYIAGVFLVLAREKAAIFNQGVKIYISSEIPLGKGVSSSAALEVAVMQAICAAFDLEIDSREKAILCQKVENLVVGAACGVMDQMSVMFGRENQLFSLLCQPAEIQGWVAIPDQIEFWGVDSGVRHAVVGADYASVRIGAFMGFRIIGELAGFEVKPTGSEGLVTIEDSTWNGYLCNLTPSEFEQFYAPKLPAEILGSEFLEKYQGTTDAVTTIDPERSYAIKTPTAHAIYENFRVKLFGEILNQAEPNLKLLGELMFQAHASYSACGLGESGTNRIVELVREDNFQNLFGAKITGGGSGGTVAILAKKGSEGAIRQLVENYESETGRRPYLFAGSSVGSAEFGIIKTRIE